MKSKCNKSDELEKNVFQNPETPSKSQDNQQPNNLQPSLLRIKAQSQLAQLNQVWNLNEQMLCQFFKSYDPIPTSKVSPLQLFDTDNVKLIRTQNKIFFGQIHHKKKQGLGIILSKGGKIYEGEFFNNEKQGYATQVYSNGNLYVGQFSQNKKHGKGSFYWFSLRDLNLQKDSKYVEQYHGDWWGGLPDGVGEHQKANGDFYVGKFKNGLKHGEGFQSYSNGDKYKGEFINGLPQGYGDYRWGDGSFYKGDFKQGYRNGYGVWRNINAKECYKGHYVLDKKHGYGIYDWGNGYIYKGNFVDDLRSGQGDLIFQNQLVYGGYWQNGQKNEDYDINTKSQFEKGKNDPQEDSIINKKQSTNSLNKKASKRGFSSVQRTKENSTGYQVSFKHVEPQERVCRRRNCFACQFKYSQQKIKKQQRLHSSSVSKNKKH